MAATDGDWRAGVQLLQQGKTAEAIEALRQAVTAAPDSVEANTYLGIALAQGGQGQEALASLHRAITLDPGNATARFNYACVLERTGHLAGAAEAFQSVLQIDPAHAKAQQALQRVQAQLAAAQPAPEPAPQQQLSPLGGAPEAAPAAQPAGPPQTPTPQPGPPTARASRSPRERPASGSKAVAAIAAVVLLAGAGAAVWWFFLRGPSPAKTAEQFLTAMFTRDGAALKELCTEDPKAFQAFLGRMGTRGGGEQAPEKITITSTSITGDSATVAAEVVTPVMRQMPGGGGDGTMELNLSVILTKEDGKWKVDLKETMPKLLTEMLQQAMQQAFQGMGPGGQKMPGR